VQEEATWRNKRKSRIAGMVRKEERKQGGTEGIDRSKEKRGERVREIVGPEKDQESFVPRGPPCNHFGSRHPTSTLHGARTQKTINSEKKIP
jgi:hypothetical protein